MFHDRGVVHYLILDTGGCRWARETGGCSMCGYANESCGRDVADDELVEEFEQLIERIPASGGSYGLRVFTSGSFLDEEEIGGASREHIVEVLSTLEGLSELTVESRPEHVTKERVRELVEGLPGTEVEVAIGLESSSDWVRENCIGKGFSFRDFARASRVIREAGARSKCYVLLKPPFLNEFDSAYDATRTVVDVADMVDSVSINSCNVQKGTLVEQLHSRGEYRPAWIWTVVEVLQAAGKALPAGKNVICDTVAFGTLRGPHNCRRCDSKAKGMVDAFSIDQDPGRLQGLECKCRGEWARQYLYRF
jgi:hypothetical protein